VTFNPELEVVVMNVTVPEAFATVTAPITKDDDDDGVVAPFVGDVCRSVPPDEPPPPPGAAVTRSEKVQVPESLRESESVPDTV
jgi:hypothetical protein